MKLVPIFLWKRMNLFILYWYKNLNLIVVCLKFVELGIIIRDCYRAFYSHKAINYLLITHSKT